MRLTLSSCFAWRCSCTWWIIFTTLLSSKRRHRLPGSSSSSPGILESVTGADSNVAGSNKIKKRENSDGGSSSWASAAFGAFFGGGSLSGEPTMTTAHTIVDDVRSHSAGSEESFAREDLPPDISKDARTISRSSPCKFSHNANPSPSPERILSPEPKLSRDFFAPASVEIDTDLGGVAQEEQVSQKVSPQGPSPPTQFLV